MAKQHWKQGETRSWGSQLASSLRQVLSQPPSSFQSRHGQLPAIESDLAGKAARFCAQGNDVEAEVGLSVMLNPLRFSESSYRDGLPTHAST